MRLRDVPAERQHQRDRVLRRGDRVRLGGVGDDDAAFGRGLDVDVVDTGPRPADHLEALGALDQLRRQPGGGADQDAVELADPVLQQLAVPIQAELDVEAVAQQLDAGVGDLLGDENLHRLTSSEFSNTQSMQAHKASTSVGSTAGNMPTSSWLQPSLR